MTNVVIRCNNVDCAIRPIPGTNPREWGCTTLECKLWWDRECRSEYVEPQIFERDSLDEQARWQRALDHQYSLPVEDRDTIEFYQHHITRMANAKAVAAQ